MHLIKTLKLPSFYLSLNKYRLSSRCLEIKNTTSSLASSSNKQAMPMSIPRPVLTQTVMNMKLRRICYNHYPANAIKQAGIAHREFTDAWILKTKALRSSSLCASGHSFLYPRQYTATLAVRRTYHNQTEQSQGSGENYKTRKIYIYIS